MSDRRTKLTLPTSAAPPAAVIEKVKRWLEVSPPDRDNPPSPLKAGSNGVANGHDPAAIADQVRRLRSAGYTYDEIITKLHIAKRRIVLILGREPPADTPNDTPVASSPGLVLSAGVRDALQRQADAIGDLTLCRELGVRRDWLDELLMGRHAPGEIVQRVRTHLDGRSAQ